MDSLENILAQGVLEVFNDLKIEGVDAKQIQFQKTRKEFDGDLTLVVFPLARFVKKSPEDAGNLLGQAIQEKVGIVTGFNVVKGFLNISVEDSYWLSFFSSILKQSQFGFVEQNSRSMVMVEYSSPNTNKPLHLGHMRNIFLGFSVANILKAYGHKVLKTQIVNDRGIHICKSMLAYQKFGSGETPESSGMKGDHLIGKYYVAFDKEYKKEMAELVAGGMSEEDAKNKASMMIEARAMLKKWEQEDPEVRALWEKMNGWVYAGFDLTYHEMGVDFDKVYHESTTYLKGLEVIQKGLDDGIFFKKEDGSVWIDLTEDGLDEKLVLRADGTAVYMTQDIGTAILRYEDFPELTYQIYTVGNEQEYHFKVLFIILEKLGFKNAKNNYHLSYGMVELPDGKMKSREGTVIDADDMLKEMRETAKTKSLELGKLEGMSNEDQEELFKHIGYGALKYFLLKIDPKKNMTFDPESSVDFVGNTGPFIQYGHVRANAILRNAGSGLPEEVSSSISLTEHDKALIQKIYDFPETIQEAASQYSPALIANYTYELVKDYNSFYQSSNVLKEENEDRRNFWIALSGKVAEVLKDSMSLLGVDMPERM